MTIWQGCNNIMICRMKVFLSSAIAELAQRNEEAKTVNTQDSEATPPLN